MKYERTPFSKENYWVVGFDSFNREPVTFSFQLHESAIKVAKASKSFGFWRIKYYKPKIS